MIDRNHPALLAALNAEYREQYLLWGRVNPETGEVQWEDRTSLHEFDPSVPMKAHAALNAALDHLTADDLPARLVRDIQIRALRATARAVTHEEDGTSWGYDLDRTAVWALLNDLADNIEGETE